MIATVPINGKSYKEQLSVHVVTVPILYTFIYSYFEKGCRKNVHATIKKGNMGYEQYAVPDTVAVEPTFVAFL